MDFGTLIGLFSGVGIIAIGVLRAVVIYTGFLV